MNPNIKKRYWLKIFSVLCIIFSVSANTQAADRDDVVAGVIVGAAAGYLLSEHGKHLHVSYRSGEYNEHHSPNDRHYPTSHRRSGDSYHHGKHYRDKHNHGKHRDNRHYSKPHHPEDRCEHHRYSKKGRHNKTRQHLSALRNFNDHSQIAFENRQH